MDEVRRETYQLVRIANFIGLAFTVAVKLYAEYFAHDKGIITYLLLAILYSLLLATPFQLTSKREIVSLLSAIIALAWLYIFTPHYFALPLFYLYIVRVAIMLNKRQAVLASAMLAVVFVVTTMFLKESTNDTGYFVFWVTMHAVLMQIIGMLAQHLAALERNERQQNIKIKQLLRQMEQSYKQVVALAEEDGLTGLYNYRTFRARISQLDITKTAIILIDIDYFKDFNDRYGHLCGDEVLRELAAILTASTRANDLLFRYGGEEFAIILQDISEAELGAVAMRIRRSVESHRFIYEGVDLGHVTVSIGYALGKAEMMSPEELFRAADVALYTAKNSGRNSVCCSEGKLSLR